MREHSQIFSLLEEGPPPVFFMLPLRDYKGISLWRFGSPNLQSFIRHPNTESLGEGGASPSPVFSFHFSGFIATHIYLL